MGKFSISKVSLICILCIVLSAFFARQLLILLVETLGRESVRLTVWIGFAILGALAVREINRSASSIKLRYFMIWLLSGVGFALLLEVPEERIHILEYGTLGYLVSNHHSSNPVFTITKATLIGLLVAAFDESIQHFLPYRVGDLRDVFFGIVGAFWGSTLSLCLASSGQEPE